MRKEIDGYPGYYIDSNGSAFHFNRQMNNNINRDGYVSISLTNNKVRKFKLAHRLVAIAFIPNPENKRTVNHKNGIKHDNILENLEWATDSENQLHSYRLGLSSAPSGANSRYSKKVKQLSLSGEYIKTWDSLHCVTKEVGFNYKNISLCALGKRPTAYGFKWEY